MRVMPEEPQPEAETAPKDAQPTNAQVNAVAESILRDVHRAVNTHRFINYGVVIAFLIGMASLNTLGPNGWDLSNPAPVGFLIASSIAIITPWVVTALMLWAVIRYTNAKGYIYGDGPGSARVREHLGAQRMRAFTWMARTGTLHLFTVGFVALSYFAPRKEWTIITYLGGLILGLLIAIAFGVFRWRFVPKIADSETNPA